MPTDRFYIGFLDSNKTGLQQNIRPYAIPDEAFSVLQNAYVFRGRVRKRFGSTWLGNTQLSSRLRINVGITSAGGVLAGNVRTFTGAMGPIAMPTSIGQAFSVGTTIFTVRNPLIGPQQMLRSDLSAAVATYNLTDSAYNITGADAATIVYFYPSLPVMGLQQFQNAAINNEPTYAFDTKFAYEYVIGGWERLNGQLTANAAIWNGSNSQFFWTTTWTGANSSDKVFFVTNFNQNEPNYMRGFDGTNWDDFVQEITATPEYLVGARIIVPFKNRLVALNTWEGDGNPGTAVNHPNRARFSQVGSPLSVDAWRQDIPGKGGGIDAATTEAIITVEFLKDRLIVYFESSTWELAYTGNQVTPFTWQQINTELGVESTFSIVPFDKVAIGVGNVGIHACNGSNVERIDEKIPNTVFDIHNDNQGVERVYGIRDYSVEMVYWTFPDTLANAEFPFCNRVLIYNYKNGTWAENDDSITVFGYLQFFTRVDASVFWDSEIITWDDEEVWGSGRVQSRFKQVVAGNQEGYTFIINPDVTTNAAVIQITDIAIFPLGVGDALTITAINHNFRIGDYVFIQDVVATGTLNLINGDIFRVLDPITADAFTVAFEGFLVGVYAGNGTISRVSQINIYTKEFNFYANKGRNAYISKVDFMVDRTGEVGSGGRLQVNFFASSSTVPLLQDSAGNDSLLGTGVLDTFAYPSVPFEAQATRLWHPVYFQAEGEVVQLQIVLNDDQMRDPIVRRSDFELGAMVIHATSTSTRLQ